MLHWIKLPPTLTCQSTATQCALWISAPYTDFPGYPLVMCIVVSCAIFPPAIDVHYSFSVPCSDSRKHHWSMRHTLTYEGTPNEVPRVVICCTPTCKDTTGCCEFGMGKHVSIPRALQSHVHYGSVRHTCVQVDTSDTCALWFSAPCFDQVTCTMG